MWNACIRGAFVTNDDGKQIDCARDSFTNRNGVWYHPDFPNLSFKFVLRDPRGHSYPENFALVVLDDVNDETKLLVAKETNRMESMPYSTLDQVVTSVESAVE